MNLTDLPVEPALISLLRKVGNYVITPDHLTIKKFITDSETVIQQLPQETPEAIKNEVSHFLKRFRKPKPNFEKEERTALQDLRSNIHIQVLPADKENDAVITEKIQRKVERIIK